jgi:tetratricopeptide (TPR) repeat protein
MSRIAVLVLAVLLAAALFLPSHPDMLRAFRLSPARPEMEAYFLELLERDPRSVPALRELIRIRMARGDLAGEVAWRERLRDLFPEDPSNLEGLQRAYTWLNRPEDAYGLALSLAERFPDRADLRERAVELAAYAEDPLRALPHARWLLERGVRRPGMRRVFATARDGPALAAVLSSPRERAHALVAAGEQKEAIIAFREHLEFAPRDLDSRRWLARLYRWNQRPLDAAAELEFCLTILDDPAVRRELVDLYRAAGRIDLMVRHLPDSVEKADVLVALGRVEEARELYSRFEEYDKLLSLSRGMPLELEEIMIRERMPLTVENRRRLADLYAWRKDFRRALALYESIDDEMAIDLHLALGDLPAALRTARRLKLWARLGDLYLWSGDLASAIEAYEKVPEERLELARLYLQVGRRADCLRLLDELARQEDADAVGLAELYVYAGRSDRAVTLLEAVPREDLEVWRVERLAEGADLRGQEPLWRFLLGLDPENEAYVLGLAETLEHLGRPGEAAVHLRWLLRRRPGDVGLLVKLGLLLSDRELLERALALGTPDPRVPLRLAELARADYRKADAIRFYELYLRLKPDDAEAWFALAQLTGDAARYRRAWDLLPPGEQRIRARILAAWGRWAEAERLFRAAGDVEGLVDLFLETGRFDDARRLPMTLRQKAVLAIKLGRPAEAVALLRRLDPRDPDVRAALGEALFALGRWQEAEEYASPELKRRIWGTYHPEAAAAVRVLDAPDERHTGISAQYRVYVSQPLYVRVGVSGAAYDGRVSARDADESFDLERADAVLHYHLAPGVRVGGGGGGWRSSLAAEAFGIVEADVRGSLGSFSLAGEVQGPWADSIEALAVGGRRHHAEAQAGFWPLAGLSLSGAAERLAYEAQEDADPGLRGATADETRLRGRAELRFLSGEDPVGRNFFDLYLRDEVLVETHLGLAAQADYAGFDGDEALVTFLRRAPSVRAILAGPTAGYAGNGWGVSAAAWVGMDSARDLAPGELWGGSIQFVATPADSWKLSASFDYVSEQSQTPGGAARSLTVGVNYNF